MTPGTPSIGAFPDPRRHFGFPGTLPHARVLHAARAAEALNINCYGVHTRSELGEPQPANTRHPHRAHETQVIRRAAAIMGLEFRTAGYVTSGATEANLLSCFVAAETARRVDRYGLVLTELAHASVRKGLRYAGLGPLSVTSIVTILSGNRGVEELQAALAGFARERIQAAGVFSTWGDPLTARTDDVHGIRRVIDEAEVPCDLFVDAAFSGLLWPALGQGTLHGARPTVLGLDLYKAVFGMIGVGLALLTPDAASRIVSAESYLPYGEERTILGSRNFTGVLAAEAVLDLVEDGTIAREYASLRPRYGEALARLGRAVLDASFPVIAFRMPKRGCTPTVSEELASFDMFGVPFGDEQLRFRICLAPHQSEAALRELLDLLERIPEDARS